MEDIFGRTRTYISRMQCLSKKEVQIPSSQEIQSLKEWKCERRLTKTRWKVLHRWKQVTVQLIEDRVWATETAELKLAMPGTKDWLKLLAACDGRNLSLVVDRSTRKRTQSEAAIETEQTLKLRRQVERVCTLNDFQVWSGKWKWTDLRTVGHEYWTEARSPWDALCATENVELGLAGLGKWGTSQGREHEWGQCRADTVGRRHGNGLCVRCRAARCQTAPRKRDKIPWTSERHQIEQTTCLRQACLPACCTLDGATTWS